MVIAISRFSRDNNIGNIHTFIKSTKTNSSSHFRATTLLPIGDSFMYLQTSSNIHGKNAFVNWEKIDIIQIANITF